MGICKFFLVAALAGWVFGIQSPDHIRFVFVYHTFEDCKLERFQAIDSIKAQGGKGWVVTECTNEDPKA